MIDKKKKKINVSKLKCDQKIMTQKKSAVLIFLCLGFYSAKLFYNACHLFNPLLESGTMTVPCSDS